ncbi:MAG TPA: bifunctional demethylmenaquinone methyltransferase/2-methoxy-6-polyprenyl-1,4-benzoquinol methylase UbiE [Vicinamibacterales bacterium]|nr:bifunctional demethylmenaquinone methyltransferase/2-methoxy-6-polyprenyl-1,4-benzoquinol methylase UbiE [Vicinamibacterales bacterium]
MSDSSLDKSPTRIAGMFDAIAPRYDLLNGVLSAGLDRYWRRRAIRSLDFTGAETLLDVCTGTGDVAIAAARAARGAQHVLGVDFAGAMLTRALEKIRARALTTRVQVVRGDAMHLPVPAHSVDGVTIAFGIRNVAEPDAACAELLRVLRPGGRLAILEFGLPVLPAVRPLYLWYFRSVLPRIGRAVSRHDAAYSYLPVSVGAFPWGEAFADILRAQGFDNVKARPLTFGIVYLYTASKSADEGRWAG